MTLPGGKAKPQRAAGSPTAMITSTTLIRCGGTALPSPPHKGVKINHRSLLTPHPSYAIKAAKDYKLPAAAQHRGRVAPARP